MNDPTRTPLPLPPPPDAPPSFLVRFRYAFVAAATLVPLAFSAHLLTPETVWHSIPIGHVLTYVSLALAALGFKGAQDSQPPT